MAPRYAIGIDLGTSNCVLAYVDLHAGPMAPAQVLPIPQLQEIDSLTTSPLLPSCFYYPTGVEQQHGWADPFSAAVAEQAADFAIGLLAQRRFAELPGRVIHSAKSWLAHGGVDREAQILPFASEEIAPELRLSPTEASAAYLDHLRQAWDYAFATADPEHAFVRQRVVITVPASFDEGAQVLTRKAAELAGYANDVRLLEEPQAGFYAWLGAAADERARGARLLALLPALVQRDQCALVCDVGGGTSDFSLFRIGKIAAAGEMPVIERIATSDHLLLGGDNIDLALAHMLEARLCDDSEASLSRAQWQQLVPQARALKERVLGRPGAADDIFPVALAGDGAGLFSAACATTAARAELQQLVLDGFFPLTAVGEQPRRRALGLREIGLPYAADSAVSRHLSAFLDGREVDALLLVGGTLQSALIQARLVELIEHWQGRRPALMDLFDMNLAVAQGAARYAALLHDGQARIRGGYPRSVHIEVQAHRSGDRPQLVCVLPQRCEPGGREELAAPQFDLLVNRPVRFSAYTSTHRPHARLGDLNPLDPRLDRPLPPLHATILVEDGAFNPRKADERSVRVRLEAALSELNVLQLALIGVESGRRWELEFNLRSPQATLDESEPSTPDSEATRQRLPESLLQSAQQRIDLFFGKKQTPGPKDNVKTLVRDLERLLGLARHRWDLPLLRSLWPALYPGITRRGRSLAHENSWLYLAGFVLRPGCGSDLDPWRMAQLWECFDIGLAHRKEKSAQANWWMMWRRTAAGLDVSQQEMLFESALPHFLRSGAEFVEGTRMLASLERIAQAHKLELARRLVERIRGDKAQGQPHVFWALTRLLSRIPLYASADAVLPASVVEEYFLRLEARDWKHPELHALAGVFAAACRRTGTRALDIDEPVRTRVIGKLREAGAKREQLRVVAELCEVSAAERNELFGEELPAGLRLSA